MKHEIDVKITRNSEEKINEFSAQDYLDKYVKLDTPNPDSSYSTDESYCKKIIRWLWRLLTNIFNRYLIFLYVIVGVNFASDQGWLGLKAIKHQTNILAVLLVILLIISGLFGKKN